MNVAKLARRASQMTHLHHQVHDVVITTILVLVYLYGHPWKLKTAINADRPTYSHKVY